MPRTSLVPLIIVGLLAASWPQLTSAAPDKRDLEEYTLLTDGDGHFVLIDERPYNKQRAGGRRASGHTVAYVGTARKLVRWHTEWTPLSIVQYRLNDDPVSGFGYSYLERRKTGWSINCGIRDVRPMRVAPAGVKKHLLSRPRLGKRSYPWKPTLIGRDSQAYYYLVERLIGKDSKTYRAHRGSPARMKLLKTKRLAADPLGFLLATTEGALEWNNDKRTLEWRPKKGPAETIKLMNLNHHRPTRKFVMRDLGVYLGKRFESPCELITRPKKPSK